MFAPICLFVYNRPDETVQTVEALKNNYLARESDLIIFSDGPKNDAARQRVKQVREYLHSINGFKSLEVIESEQNKGLANSIISGVSQVIQKSGRVIVLEDDLITSRNFLNFMNQALNFYSNNKKIYSISGYSFNLPALKGLDEDFYTGYRASSWGWATWADRWENIDWEVKDYRKFKIDPYKNYQFMRGGSDLPFMLWKQMKGIIDSWAIRWCYHQYKNKLLTVFPVKSKIQNIGFSNDATHTTNAYYFKTVLDNGNKTEFEFSVNTSVNQKIAREFRSKFSLWRRLKNRLSR